LGGGTVMVNPEIGKTAVSGDYFRRRDADIGWRWECFRWWLEGAIGLLKFTWEVTIFNIADYFFCFP